MANTVTVTKIINGTKRDVIHVYIAGDGSGEVTKSVIYDYSADTYAPNAVTKLFIDKIWMTSDAVSPSIAFDGATDFQAWGQGNNIFSIAQDFTHFGGIPNRATTPTGDVTITTVGLGSGEHIYLVLDLRKM